MLLFGCCHDVSELILFIEFPHFFRSALCNAARMLCECQINAKSIPNQWTALHCDETVYKEV